MNKIWHKPLHCRKVWKNMSLYSKIVYYLRPFVVNLIETWQQPLPFPTLFKLVYSCILIMLTLIPILVPIIICIGYYVILQILVESALDITYPRNFDIIHFMVALFKLEIKNEKHIEYLNLYWEKWCYTITTLASCIDYMRLGLSVVLN